MHKILAALKGAVYEHKEEEKMAEIAEEQWIDPTPNLIEGIFEIN